MEIERSNHDFEANLQKDTEETLQKRDFMNNLIIETEAKKERVYKNKMPEVEDVDDSYSDTASQKMCGHAKKHLLGKSFSSVNVTTKNGYLFSKRVRPHITSAYGTKREPNFDDESSYDGDTNRTYESSFMEKPTIRQQVPKKFGNRYKYF